MIISRTPFRISLFGGGTDFPDWYKNFGSVIISCTINKYSYIILRRLPSIVNYKYHLRYFDKEEVKNINKIKHNSYREILKLFKFSNVAVEVIHSADLPALSGLGASSSSTVGMINAAINFKKKKINKKKLAKLAIKIEQNILKEHVGSQDQVAASYGGFNKIVFKKNLDFNVNKLSNLKNITKLNKCSLLVYTGIQRKSGKIELEKKKKIINKSNNEKLTKMNEITNRAVKEFKKKNINIKNIGLLLKEQWLQKKLLAKKVSNKKINRIYKVGIQSGAYGGKLLGAGRGGFMFFICPEKKKRKILRNLIKIKKIQNINFKFENNGSDIIYKNLNNF